MGTILYGVARTSTQREEYVSISWHREHWSKTKKKTNINYEGETRGFGPYNIECCSTEADS